MKNTDLDVNLPAARVLEDLVLGDDGLGTVEWRAFIVRVRARLGMVAPARPQAQGPVVVRLHQ